MILATKTTRTVYTDIHDKEFTALEKAMASSLEYLVLEGMRELGIEEPEGFSAVGTLRIITQNPSKFADLFNSFFEAIENEKVPF